MGKNLFIVDVTLMLRIRLKELLLAANERLGEEYDIDCIDSVARLAETDGEVDFDDVIYLRDALDIREELIGHKIYVVRACSERDAWQFIVGRSSCDEPTVILDIVVKEAVVLETPSEPYF